MEEVISVIIWLIKVVGTIAGAFIGIMAFAYPISEWVDRARKEKEDKKNERFKEISKGTEEALRY